jgi:uncharacterized protein
LLHHCLARTPVHWALSRIAASHGGRPAAGLAELFIVTSTAHVHHAIDYIEFAVSDMGAAQRFYADAFGWSFNDYGPGYAGIRQGNGEAGGFRVEPTVVAGGPLVILYSEDLEGSLAKVRAAGGVITVEPFDFPGGRRFQFRDPSGNELSVWTVR